MIHRLWRQLSNYSHTQREIKPISLLSLFTSLTNYPNEIAEEVSRQESHKHGGFQSGTGTKAMREGLWLAKQCIRNSSASWISVSANEQIDTDKLWLLDKLSNWLEDSQNDIKTHEYRKLQKYLLDEKKQAEHTKCDDVICISVTDYQRSRQEYIHKLFAALQSVAPESINRVAIDNLMSLYFEQYLTHSSLAISALLQPFYRDALACIDKHRAVFNHLPGDDGVYELVSLNSVAERIKRKLTELHHD